METASSELDYEFRTVVSTTEKCILQLDENIVGSHEGSLGDKCASSIRLSLAVGG